MRPSLDETLIGVALAFAKRSTCSRLHVGAVLARDARVIATGYNGVAAGLPHCVHESDEPCADAVHAEANAVAFAARHGISTAGATLYVTHAPCPECAKLLVNAGIARVAFLTEYRLAGGIELLQRCGISAERLALI